MSDLPSPFFLPGLMLYSSNQPRYAYVLRAIKTPQEVSPPHPALTLTLSQMERGRKTYPRKPTQPSPSMREDLGRGEIAAHGSKTFFSRNT
jgi:hypothetical protein